MYLSSNLVTNSILIPEIFIFYALYFGKLGESWTTILRRQDGSVHFSRNWQDYKNGFGNPDSDFFIGLEKLHQITSHGSPQELLVVLIDFDNQTRFANYNLFRIGNESQNYALTDLGAYTGDAGDGMIHHKGQPFLTFERDNGNGNIRNCAGIFKDGWWYFDPCYIGHLCGPYRKTSELNSWGVSWGPWRGWDYSLKYAAMMIRSKLYESWNHVPRLNLFYNKAKKKLYICN